MVPKPESAAAPLRTCVGCRTVRPQTELVRVARRSDGTLVVGRTLPGRGAWLCRDRPECLERAAVTGGFARAFRASIGSEQLVDLRRELQVRPPEA